MSSIHLPLKQNTLQLRKLMVELKGFSLDKGVVEGGGGEGWYECGGVDFV